MKYLKLFESNITDTKILILIFLTKRGSEKFIKYQRIFNNLDVNWWVKPQGAHHLGLSYQSILDTDDLDIARRIAEYIENSFDEPILICLSKNSVSNFEPVSESSDRAWWKIGREFDKMVSNNETGIHIIKNNK